MSGDTDRAVEAGLTARQQDLQEQVLSQFKVTTVLFGEPDKRDQHLALADQALAEYAASRGLRLVPLSGYPRSDTALDVERLTIENDLIARMFAAIRSNDPMLKDAIPGSALEHVYTKVYSQLATMAENARKAEDSHD